jgi:hypothetical protein
MVGDPARRGYGIEGMLLGAQDQRSRKRKVGGQGRAAAGDSADDLDQIAVGSGREFGDASARIVESHNASPICRGKYPMQPVAGLLLRDKDVLRRMLDNRPSQFLATAGTGAKKRSEARSASLAISASHHCVNWFGNPSKNISIG